MGAVMKAATDLLLDAEGSGNLEAERYARGSGIR